MVEDLNQHHFVKSPEITQRFNSVKLLFKSKPIVSHSNAKLSLLLDNKRKFHSECFEGSREFERLCPELCFCFILNRWKLLLFSKQTFQMHKTFCCFNPQTNNSLKQTSDLHFKRMTTALSQHKGKLLPNCFLRINTCQWLREEGFDQHVPHETFKSIKAWSLMATFPKLNVRAADGEFHAYLMFKGKMPTLCGVNKQQRDSWGTLTHKWRKSTRNLSTHTKA